MIKVKEGMEDMRTQIGDMNARMGTLGADMEAIKEYLRDLREATMCRDGNDKGKAPMHPNPSPLYSPPGREASLPPPKRTKEAIKWGQREEERMKEGWRELQYYRYSMEMMRRTG